MKNSVISTNLGEAVMLASLILFVAFFFASCVGAFMQSAVVLYSGITGILGCLVALLFSLGVDNN